jgi:hypothetical protein
VEFQNSLRRNLSNFSEVGRVAKAILR